MRFRVDPGSQTAHCCFEFTVVDTDKPMMIKGLHFAGRHGPQFEAVCECFDEADAIAIAAALNAITPTTEAPEV